jgi:hypothetical protein
LDCLNTPCPDGTVRGTVLDLSPSTGSAERPVIDRFSDGCFGGGDPAVFEAVVAARFQESVTPSRAVVQPATGRALVNLPLVAYAEPVTDTWTPTLLGTPVTIRATPVSYVWDFGDGSASVVTDHPGGPYPDHAQASATARSGIAATIFWSALRASRANRTWSLRARATATAAASAGNPDARISSV